MPTKFSEDEVKEIVLQCRMEYDHALQYRQQRESQWASVDDAYFGKKKKSLVSRANVHLPYLQGAVETWVGKVDDPPRLGYDPQEEGDKPKANSLTGLLRHDQRKGYWDLKDLLNKRVAGMYGRAIYKKFSDSQDGFTDHFEVVDPLDFLIDPQAGGLMPFDQAQYCGQDNIIRSKYQLQDKDLYDQDAVAEIVGKMRSDSSADNRFQSMTSRRSALGLSNAVYLSDDSCKLLEWYTTYRGERVYCLLSYEFQVSVRCLPLKDLFASDEFPFASWAVFPHPFEFWTPGVGEIFKEVNQVQDILVSQVLDNNSFRNYGMRFFDETKIANPALLDPKPMGKIPVTGNPRDAVMSVEFPSIVDSLNLMGFLNTSFSRDSGVSDQAKGMPNSKRMSATEFSGLLDQVADRFFTVNRTYRECYRRIAELYRYGVEENMTQERRVKVLGTKGYEWRKVSKEDVLGNFDVVVTTDSTEEQAQAVEKQTFQLYMQQARMNQRLNQSFLDEKEARVMGFTEEEISRLLNPDLEGDWEILAYAASENEDMLSHAVPPNLAATAGHVQKHLDFARKTNGLKPKVKDRVLAHAEQEIGIAAENEVRKAKDLVERKKALLGQQMPMEQNAPAPQGPLAQLPPGAIHSQTTVIHAQSPMGAPPTLPISG